jgi:hypothetical protein
MVRLPRAACLGAMILLAGCGHPDRGGPPEDSATRADIPAPPDISAADSTSPARAVSWIQDYYRAINERRFRDAYQHWERGGLASGKSFDEFQKGFAATERVEITVGAPGPVEGAAGSRYVEVPVGIAARTRDGARQNYSGSYTLRLSVVDGATPEQRAWHINSAKVRSVN